MANFSILKSAIEAVIKTNGNNEITGALLQQSLLSMISSLGAHYGFVDVATPFTNPGTPDQNVMYFAATAGIYSNFGGIVVGDGEACFLCYNGTWVKKVSGAATVEQIIALGEQISALSLGKFYGFFTTTSELPVGDIPGYAYVGASAPFAIYDFVNGTWSDSGAVYGPAEGNGEDIDTNAQGKLQFADRPNTDGMGYVILRKNKTFAEQVTAANTIYEIRYDFDLGGASVTIPAGCVLKFVGGKLSNGTIDGNGVEIIAENSVILNVDITNIRGTIRSDWFGVVADGTTDDTTALARIFAAVSNGCIVEMQEGISVISSAISLADKSGVEINANGFTLKYAAGMAVAYPFQIERCVGLTIRGLQIDANEQDVVGIRLIRCDDFRLYDVAVRNCGTATTTLSLGGIAISGCTYGDIQNPIVENVIVSTSAAASGIWVGDRTDDNVDYNSKYITISNAFIKNIRPKADADGIKILGTNSDEMRHFTVRDSYFEDCAKRALKFQARGCASFNNYAVFKNTAPYAFIDFQRGWGTSYGDRAELYQYDLDGVSHGFCYAVFYVCDGHTTIENARVSLGPNVNTSVVDEQTALSSHLFRIDRVSETDFGSIVLKNIYCDVAYGLMFFNNPSVASILRELYLENIELALRGRGGLFEGSAANLTIDSLNINNIRIFSIAATGGYPNLLPLPTTNNISFNYYGLPQKFERRGIIGKRTTIFWGRFRSDGTTTLIADNFDVRGGKVVFFPTTDSNPNNAIYSSGNNIQAAKVGDEFVLNSPIIDSVAGTICRKWVCVEDPSTEHKAGVWVKIIENTATS